MTASPAQRAAAQRGSQRLHEKAEEALAAFIEERRFFMQYCGMNDRQICERLGENWDSYRQRFRRHPELGPIVDPEETERLWWAELMKPVGVNWHDGKDRR